MLSSICAFFWSDNLNLPYCVQPAAPQALIQSIHIQSEVFQAETIDHFLVEASFAGKHRRQDLN